MIPLVLKVKEKSALNSFSTLNHEKVSVVENEGGDYTCSMRIENSIELFLRLVQCGTSVEVLSPETTREKYISMLESILRVYKK